MATFSKQFLANLGQPAMTQGMFDLGAAIGGIPGRRRQAQKTANLQKGLFGLEQSALAGELTPEMYKEAVGSYTALMQQNPEQADEIRKSLARVGASVREQDKAQKKVTAVNELSAIETEYTKIYSDPSLGTKERDARATALRTRAKAIQDANPLVDFSSFSNWDSRAMNAGMAISSRVQNQKAEVEQQKVDVTLQGMTPEEREDYVETYTGSESEYMLRRVNSLNTYEDGVQRRASEAATREQTLDNDIDSLASQIETLPEGLRDSLTKELNLVKKMQEANYGDSGWKSKTLQNQANNKLNDVSRRIINHSDRVADADRRSIREADIKITALESQLNNPVMDQKILDRYAESAAQQAGESRSFDKISASKKEEYYNQARADILRDHNQNINSQIRTQKAVKRYLSGEAPEEQSTTETTAFSSTVDEAVAETGRPRSEVITALKKRGDIPKDYSEKEQSFEEAVELSETEVITALFGDQGYIAPLGLDTKSVSKAFVEDRVYFAVDTNKSLAGVPTNDLELLQYDNNKYTPMIKAELKRRGR